MKSTIQKSLPVIALLLFTLGITGIVWSFTPPRYETITLPLQEIEITVPSSSKDTENYAALLTPYEMTLKLPRRLKTGNETKISFSFSPSPNMAASTQANENLYLYYNMVIELRPEFDTLQITPPGSMSTAVLEGSNTAMQWTLITETSMVNEGLFWVYLNFYPLDSSMEIQRTAVLAKPITLISESPFGLSTRWVAVVSSVFLTLSFFFGWPTIGNFIFGGKHQLRRHNESNRSHE